MERGSIIPNEIYLEYYENGQRVLSTTGLSYIDLYHYTGLLDDIVNKIDFRCIDVHHTFARRSVAFFENQEGSSCKVFYYIYNNDIPESKWLRYYRCGSCRLSYYLEGSPNKKYSNPYFCPDCRRHLSKFSLKIGFEKKKKQKVLKKSNKNPLTSWKNGVQFILNPHLTIEKLDNDDFWKGPGHYGQD